METGSVRRAQRVRATASRTRPGSVAALNAAHRSRPFRAARSPPFAGKPSYAVLNPVDRIELLGRRFEGSFRGLLTGEYLREFGENHAIEFEPGRDFRPEADVLRFPSDETALHRDQVRILRVELCLRGFDCRIGVHRRTHRGFD